MVSINKETFTRYQWNTTMAEEKKIDTENRNKRFIYTENDAKSIFQYGPLKKSAEKIEKK